MARRGKRTGRQPARRTAPRPSEEARFLSLARELTGPAAAGVAPGDRLRNALARLAGDRAPGPARTRAQKVRALSLGWAREQVRLALEEIIAGAVAAGAARSDVPAEMLAWLLLAGTDALAHESPEAAVDRLQALERLVGPGPARAPAPRPRPR
jgi:hypothetical protein